VFLNLEFYAVFEILSHVVDRSSKMRMGGQKVGQIPVKGSDL